jgi:hypothetical protein
MNAFRNIKPEPSRSCDEGADATIDRPLNICQFMRPTFVRDSETCTSLDGPWQFVEDTDSDIDNIKSVCWNQQTINVPFTRETSASGIARHSNCNRVFYGLSTAIAAAKNGERIYLNIGAANNECRIYVNGNFAGSHTGGYTPIRVEITPFLKKSALQRIEVQVDNDIHDKTKPSGKDSWVEGGWKIWYLPRIGIWQSVWIERVPNVALTDLRWTNSVSDLTVGFSIKFQGPVKAGYKLVVKLQVSGQAGDPADFYAGGVLVDDVITYLPNELDGHGLARTYHIADAGEGYVRDYLLWEPRVWDPVKTERSMPPLIHALFRLLDERGNVVDTVRSYTAIKEVRTDGRDLLVNRMPAQLDMLLHQQYFSDTGLTPPDDAAIRHDVEQIKLTGCNGIRAHQAIPHPRLLYWADVLGLHVWEELPSGYKFSDQLVNSTVKLLTEAVERDYNHPCRMAWVVLNESWGTPDIAACDQAGRYTPLALRQQNFLTMLCNLAKTLDPNCLIIGNDGWQFVEASSIWAVHDYDQDGESIAQRFADENLDHLFECEKPGGRKLLLSADEFGSGKLYRQKPLGITECGGTRLVLGGQSEGWGYADVDSAFKFKERFRSIWHALRRRTNIRCWTQFTDVHTPNGGEINGLFTIEREPKLPLPEMFHIIKGVM